MGGAGTVQHGPEAEQRQQHDGDEWWQDSAFVVWHADDAGIGGVMRIGHEPGFDGGIAALWCGIAAQDGTRFRRNTAAPLTEADLRPDGFGALGGRYQLVHDGGHLHYRIDDDDCRVELEVEDFYPRTDFFPKDAGSLHEEFASNHFESSGRITGTVELGGRSYEVDGLCHRDRSWGLRRWDTLLNHRWIPGTVGPELSFGSIAWHAVDGTIRQYGYVVRDGEVIRAEEVEIVVHMEPDGTTYRGGTAVWTFADGETLELAPRPYDGIVFGHHGVVSVDAICPIEIDGRRGFCDLEVSTNPRAGTAPLTAAMRANRADGLSRRPIGEPAAR